MLENGALIELADEDRDTLRHAQVSQTAIHMKRIQIVLQGFSHLIRLLPDQRGIIAGVTMFHLILRRLCQTGWTRFFVWFQMNMNLMVEGTGNV